VGTIALPPGLGVLLLVELDLLRLELEALPTPVHQQLTLAEASPLLQNSLEFCFSLFKKYVFY
jgi:hypothetical protein